MTFDDFWILMMCEPLCLLGVWTARVGSNPPLATNKKRTESERILSFFVNKERELNTEIIRWCRGVLNVRGTFV